MSEANSAAAFLLAQRAKKKQESSRPATKGSHSDIFDPTSNLIDFENFDTDIAALRNVNTDFLLSDGQLKARPPSGKSAKQLLKPLTKEKSGPEVPKGTNMKNYIIERQKQLKSETSKATQALHKAQTFKPKQKSLAENPYYLGKKQFENEKNENEESKKPPVQSSQAP